MSDNLKKLLHKASKQFDLWDVFNDFLLLTATTIANNSDPCHTVTSKAEWAKREQRYLETIRKYDKNEQELFPQMFAELVKELENHSRVENFEDVLGKMFHELELHNKWKDQYFTPQHVSDMMGRMITNKDELAKRIKARGYVNLNEPCCGGGAMIYGFVNALRGYGFNHSKNCLIYASDIDERCVWMTYIQCSLYGLPAVVVQMDTLNLKQLGKPWYSPAYIWDMWRFRERSDACALV